MRNFFNGNCLSRNISRPAAWFFLAGFLAVLAGCGSGSQLTPSGGTGGGSTGVSQTITGTAATGAPLAGAAVTVEDSAGKTVKGTTAADGTFTVAVTGLKPPFMLVAVPTSGSNLYSVLPAMDMSSTNTQNVNITPITTLVLYELNAGADPATMYTGLSFATLTAGVVTEKETLVRGKLPANTVNPIFSMMYGKFTAKAGGSDPYDLALDALGKITAIAASGVTLTNSTGTSTTYTSSGSNSSAAGATLSLKLTDPATGAAVTSISSTSSAILTATFTSGSGAGAGVANAIVTFSTDATLVKISPALTATTNATGVATVTLTPATLLAAGPATISASATGGTASASTSVGLKVGTATVTVTAPVFGTNPLSAFGTTSMDVTVSVGGVPVTTPQNVTFSSICADLGKAVLSTGTVTGAGGVAKGSYQDKGCAATDTITASAAGATSAPTDLVVTPTAVGSIQFISASPGSMALQGIGGTEASLVSFKVVDGGGKPLAGKTVTFGLSTAVGGIRLSPTSSGVASSVSDSNGVVAITVNSGTVSTPVRVTATTVDTSTTPSTTLTTQSSGLTISTGVPDQDSFSLSVSLRYVEDGNTDGGTTVFTARLADHFNNPVPDGTVVNFTTSGGSITPSCFTTGGICSSTLTVQNPRPANGKVTVLAYAVGEESFIDLNGNGVADLPNLSVKPNVAPNEMSDINGNSTDMPEAFRDDNQNGVFDPTTETFIDFNGNGKYDGPDGQYNGVLCDARSSPGTCSATRSIHVRRSGFITFSDSTAVITKTLPASTIDVACAGVTPIIVQVVDKKNGNPMPTGTLINISGVNGAGVALPNSFTQGNDGVTDYSVNVVDSRSFCGSGSGAITVEVKTPRGVTTSPIPTYPVTLN